MPKGLNFPSSVFLLMQGLAYSINAETLVRDVAIIGGGSSGTYSAIRLQQLGKSVALIENEDRLGGHVNTYIDPSSGVSFDYGVILFDNISVVTNYFDYLDVELTKSSFAPGATVYANFENGSAVPAPSTSDGALLQALETYTDQLDHYPYLTTGWQDLPSSLPDDLFISWGDFIQKYQLSAIANIAFEYLQGAGNFLTQPTIYMLKYLNALTVDDLISGNVLTTAKHDNQGLYDSALAKLGSNAFLNSKVIKVRRSSAGVQLTVSTPSGVQQINASKLLVAIQPSLSNIGPFLDLDAQESTLFGQFNNSYYWDAVVQNSGIPDNVTLENLNPANPLSLPTLPGIYRIMNEAVSNVHALWYCSPHYMSNEAVQADIMATLDRLNAGLGYPKPSKTARLVGFNNHSPFELTVSTEAIKNGFYKQLTALQGQRNTYWTGATWQGAHDSSAIWNYTEYEILPKLAS